ncbi:MAG TPA: TlpA disulfide reductase family protein [Actinomycetes bacterium]|nr:TlpA disulfide reductase family protein [Actinomycetes bacterium]
MSRPRRALLVAGLITALLLTGCVGDEPSPAADPAGSSSAQPAGRTSGPDRTCPHLEPATARPDGLPDLELPCLEDGPAVNLKDLRGTPTVLNVWAAWCTNCDREMPILADAMDRAGPQLRFFGVHYKATREQGRSSEDDFGVPFPSVHDPDGDRTALALKATAPPQTFFVAADGQVVGRKVGEITSRAMLDELVERYLGVQL